MQFFHQKGNFSALNLRCAYFVWSEMSKKSIIMFLGMNNTRLGRKILIILDFEDGFLPTYLPLCTVFVSSTHLWTRWFKVDKNVFGQDGLIVTPCYTYNHTEVLSQDINNERVILRLKDHTCVVEKSMTYKKMSGFGTHIF